MDDNALDATVEYIKRRDRVSHPHGLMDDHGRWYPYEDPAPDNYFMRVLSPFLPNKIEKQSCCDHIRRPSARYPYSLQQHCRSLEHVARLFGVEPGEIRSMLKKKNLPLLVGTGDPYVDQFIETRLKKGAKHG